MFRDFDGKTAFPFDRVGIDRVETARFLSDLLGNIGEVCEERMRQFPSRGLMRVLAADKLPSHGQGWQVLQRLTRYSAWSTRLGEAV